MYPSELPTESAKRNLCVTVGKVILPRRKLLWPAHYMAYALGQEPLRGSRAAGNRLPKFAENFTTHVTLPGFAITDHTVAGAEDANAQAIKHGA